MPLVDPRSNEYAVNKLTSGSIVGHTTSHSCRLWIRNYAEGRWSLIWSEQPLPGDLRQLDGLSIDDYLQVHGIDASNRIEHDFSFDSHLTHCFELDKLKPDTRYWYALVSDDRTLERRSEIGFDQPPSFLTQAEGTFDFSFGFYSCHDPFAANGNFGAWPQLQERLQQVRARFVIGGGDQIYVDSQDRKWFPDIWEWLRDNRQALLETYTGSDGTLDRAGIQRYILDLYRWYYRVYWSFPHLRRVYASYPQYMIWDDHEIMDGWGSRTREERLRIVARALSHGERQTAQMLVDMMWQAARTAYYEYAHSHNPPTPIKLDKPASCQWDYLFEQGGVPFFVFDSRGHHDVERKEFRQLGKAQFKRFSQWLQQACAGSSPLLFAVLPVPIVHWKAMLVQAGTLIDSAKDDVLDEWEHRSNHKERNLILDTLFGALHACGKSLILLSGDVHSAAAFRLHHDDFPQGKVFQITSSAISRPPVGKLARVGLAGSGRMSGHEHIYQEALFGHTEQNNFAILHVQDSRVSVEFQWIGGENGETCSRTLALC